MVDPEILFSWYVYFLTPVRSNNPYRYNGLSSRTVDLVGDYAGDELFIIDGDSLLLHVFSDEKLDFSPGFQLLHAAYMVEAFLHALLRRKCHFHIAFFADNSHLCTPPDAPRILSSRYLLAREAIIQHLCHNLHHVTPHVEIKLFEGYQSEGFKAYLASSGAYFFMCHDGALSERRLDMAESDESDSDVDSDLEDSGGNAGDADDEEFKIPPGKLRSKNGFRNMVHWFICQGYNVALVNTVECRDTKVWLSRLMMDY